MAGNLTLSWLLVGVIVFVGVVMLVYDPNWGIYNGIVDNNGGAIDSIYSAAYLNLTNDASDIAGLSNNLLEPTNLWSVFTDATFGLVNTLALGLNAIGLLVQIPTFINHINSVLAGVSFIPAPFWWIIETVVVVIGASLLIRALRGTTIEP